MIKISDAVREIINEDPIASEAMQRGFLNLSSYAESILQEVETRTMKEVQVGSIVVSLSRMMKTSSPADTLSPYVPIRNISMKGSLAELTYEKTEESLVNLSQLDTSAFRKREFFALTEGLAEITIVCPIEELSIIKNHFATKPKAEIRDLVAISVRFPSEFLDIPNAIYTLVSALAVKRINLSEIISTYTELTFIVKQAKMEDTLASLRRFMH